MRGHDGLHKIRRYIEALYLGMLIEFRAGARKVADHADDQALPPETLRDLSERRTLHLDCKRLMFAEQSFSCRLAKDEDIAADDAAEMDVHRLPRQRIAEQDRLLARKPFDVCGELKAGPRLWNIGRRARLSQAEAAIDPIAVIMLDQLRRDDEISRRQSRRQASREAGEDHQLTLEAVIEKGGGDADVDFPNPRIGQQNSAPGQLSRDDLKPRDLVSLWMGKPLNISVQLLVQSEYEGC